MPLNFIIGRAGSKKSDRISYLAAKKQGILIVPETHSLASEKKLLQYTDVLGLGGAEVLSFQRLAHRYSDFGPLGKSFIDSSGKNMALALICQNHVDELKTFGKTALKAGFATEMLSLITEFKRYGVSPEALISVAEKKEDSVIAGKLSDIALIYEKYLDFISSGYSDSDDNLSRLALYLSEHKPLSGRHIFIDRFSSFTPIELNIIKLLMRDASSVTVTLCLPKNESGFHFASAENTLQALENAARELSCECSYEYLDREISGELSFIERSFFSYTPKAYDDAPENVFMFVADSMYSEVEHTARTIFNLVREKKADYSDIFVLCRDSEAYAPFIKSIFPTFSIPVTDTERISAAAHPLSLYILSSIEAAISLSSFTPLLKYLKSGFCGIDRSEADIFENYILASGIYPSQFYNNEKWLYKTDMYRSKNADDSLIDTVNETREKILAELRPLKNALKGSVNAEAFCRAVYSFMEETALPSKVSKIINELTASGETDRASTLESVYNCIISAMDSLIACSKDAVLPSSKFLSVFREGLCAVSSSIIPSGIACVNFEGASRTKGAHAPIVFILGLNSGVFPKIPESGGILTNSERIMLDGMNIPLSPDKEHLNYEELALLYSALTAAENRLYLSYPLRSADGASLSPSSGIQKIHELFPRLIADSDVTEGKVSDCIASPESTFRRMLAALNSYALGEDIDPEWFMLLDWYKKHGYHIPKIPNSFSSMGKVSSLDSDMINSLFPDSFKTSISKLESYSECRFRYFMNYVLKARPRLSADFNRGDVGSLLHMYAENVSSYLEDRKKSWENLTDGEIKKILSDTTAFVLENGSYYLKNSSRAVYLVKRLESLANKILLIIREHFENGLFTPLGSEIVFDDGGSASAVTIPTPDGDVRLTGKVDRADVLSTPEGDFVRIVDYKSGNKTFSFSEIYSGLNLQLSVYMMALTADGKIPGGMFYLKFDDPIISDKDNGKRKSPEKIMSERTDNSKMRGLMLDSDSFLNTIDPEMKKSTDRNNIGSANGKFYSASLATKENFNMIFKRVKEVISSLTHEMRKGDFSISPIKKGQASPCDYCDYKSACYKEGSVRDMPNIESSVWEHFEKGGDIL